MATLDGRALNAVLWRYPERIRQIDAMCDEAELRGIADAPPELAPLGIGLGWTLWLLENARLSETEDREPNHLAAGRMSTDRVPAPCRRHRFCRHPFASFDRSLCAADGWMHTYCDVCGRPLDGECGDEPDHCRRCGEVKDHATLFKGSWPEPHQ